MGSIFNRIACGWVFILEAAVAGLMPQDALLGIKEGNNTDTINVIAHRTIKQEPEYQI